ncbi:hypothetical protein [Nocardia aurea]|uniref:hypothetical protein n=1 Tax=Nocardia aurea TaxID=2144174 RepID=UPI001E382348|nr:hypothetical protein [Nocardia aurea]
MSDINGDNHRVRRRAVRSVGPPVEEDADGTSGVTAATTETKAQVGTAKVPATATASTAARGDGADAAKKSGSDAAAKAAKSVGGSGDVVADATTEPGGVAAKPAVTTKKAPPAAEPKAVATAAVTAVAAVDAAAVDAAVATAAVTDAAAAADVAAADVAAADVAAADVADADAAADTDTPVALAKSGADGIAEKPKRRAGRIAAVVAAAVLVLLTVVGAGASTYLVHTTNERDERRAEYVQTARQAVLNLTTIRADSAKADIDRILSLASGQFKTEFDGRVDPFMSIVQQAKVVSNGEVVEAAIQQDDENSAQVLVAAKQTLSNAGQAEPQTRYYRFRVTVSRGDTGLTASKVEFVA